MRHIPSREFTTFCVTSFVLAALSSGLPSPAAAQGVCPTDAPLREYHVSAIDVAIPLNRWGDHLPTGKMYALAAEIPNIRDFEAALERDRAKDEVAGEPDALARVTQGLRDDPIQPLVLRVNLGDCLRLHFTNLLSDGPPATFHVPGLPRTPENAGGAVGRNVETFTALGETVVYEYAIPLDPSAEGAYVFHDQGGQNRERQQDGLFGALIVEPRGAVYLDVETGEPIDTTSGGHWEAVVLDPDLDARDDAKSFREFVIFYHEFDVLEIRDREGKKIPLDDNGSGTFHPLGNAISYRSEAFLRRWQLAVEIGDPDAARSRSLTQASYTFGDPPTPIPRSYLGESTKIRLVHGGGEVFQVHHQHGARWRLHPDADAAGKFWRGLTKVSEASVAKPRDVRTLGPGTSYTLEPECGAGGCQQAAGDLLFRSHIGHHHTGGMWSFWRVFDTVQTAATNLNSRHLFVAEELFQAEGPFDGAEAPSSNPPRPGVPADELLGLAVDDGRVIVEDDAVVDPQQQIGLRAWIRAQLPPPGERFDRDDATVWDWVFDESGPDLRVLGEPEATRPFANYVSATPGERPEVLFNPENGRYAWPLLRPHVAMRPPFAARHGGAPWLGDDMKPGRLDGLCARNGVHPAVNVGNATDRFYPLSAFTASMPVTRERTDSDGLLFALNEHVDPIRRGERSAEPLAFRSNVGDCVEVLFTNQIPDAPLHQGFSKIGLHSHLVQYDPQASDGVVAGFSYEQTVRTIASEGRRLSVPTAAGDTVIRVGHTERLRPGVTIGVGLGEGMCGGEPCTEIRRIVDLTADTITLDAPLDFDHGAEAAVGVEFVRYRWYSDTDLGTVFLRGGPRFQDLGHGLFAAHVVEPPGSTYHDPSSGEEIRAGTAADIHIAPRATSPKPASFREFVLFAHDSSPVGIVPPGRGGTINLRAEPWSLREDSAYRFSSVRYGDPVTPLLRAYVGDPVIVRTAGSMERVGGLRFTGHRFARERSAASALVDTVVLGHSETFDVAFEGGAGGPARQAGDYLYYSTWGQDFEAGAWGLLRVHDALETGLEPLPDRPVPSGPGFPQLEFTGDDPPSLVGPGDVCPADAPRRTYSLVIANKSIVYDENSIPERGGVIYRLPQARGQEVREPFVVRANAGDCLVLLVRNARQARSSISLGKLLFDPQRSYGAAVGFNYDSTLAPGQGRRYKYYADRELGVALALNLGDVESIEHGAFGAVVVEPAGSRYFQPGERTPLVAGGWGLEADIVSASDELLFREHVVLWSDQDRLMGHNRRPHRFGVVGRVGLSFAAEPFEARGAFEHPAEVFHSPRWGDPRNVVTVRAGTPLLFRVAQPWGYQAHVPAFDGHRFQAEPGLEGSEVLHSDVLGPGLALDLHLLGGAGGADRFSGDYLFFERRQPFLEAGLWQILRVTEE